MCVNYLLNLSSWLYFSTLGNRFIEETKTENVPEISLTASKISQIPRLFPDSFYTKSIYMILPEFPDLANTLNKSIHNDGLLNNTEKWPNIDIMLKKGYRN